MLIPVKQGKSAKCSLQDCCETKPTRVGNDHINPATLPGNQTSRRRVVCLVCGGQLDGNDALGKLGRKCGKIAADRRGERAQTGVDDCAWAYGKQLSEFEAKTSTGAGDCEHKGIISN